MIFKQAKNISLNQSTGTLPDLSGVLDGWLQKMQFSKITKSIVNFKVIEVLVVTDFEGVWEGVPSHMLSVKPEGQRAWKWYNIWSKTNLSLVPDEIITYQGENYRVKQENDYSLYGYHFYEVCQDFSV